MITRQAIASALVALVPAIVLAGCVNPPDADSRDLDEHTAAAAAEPAVADAAVRVEQAERALEVGRDVAAARATLAAVTGDKNAPPDVRERAAMSLSRACEVLKDTECAIRTVEDLLAAHGDDRRWPGAEKAEKRLRKLLTGKDEKDSLQQRHLDKTSAFAHVLAGHFAKKDTKEPVEISLLAFGSDGHTSRDLGTFNVEDALREKAQQDCPACDDGLKLRAWFSQTDSWTAIPAMKSRLGGSIVAFYTHLADPIPARYDELLPIAMSEVTAHLQKGEGLVVAKERAGAPPVILVAAPREAQLAEVERTLAEMDKLPVSPVVVKVSPNVTQHEIKGVMRANAMPALKKCYEELLGRTPAATGKLELSFAIEGSGELTGLEAKATDTLDDATFVQCTANGVKGLRFPASGAARTTVKYPFTFSP